MGWSQGHEGTGQQNTGGGAPDGPAGGDLTSSYPNPLIAAGAVTDSKVAAANVDGLAAVPSMRTLGTGAQQAAAGTDSRLTNARTPTAHHTTHVTGGTDIIANAVASGAAGLMSGTDKAKLDGIGALANVTSVAGHTGVVTLDHATDLSSIGTSTHAQIDTFIASKAAASGLASLDSGSLVPIAQIPTGSTSSTVCIGNDSRLTNARTPTAHATSHVTGGSDIIANAVASGAAGLMSGTDKAKLDGIGSGANVTSVAGHTGVVTLSHTADLSNVGTNTHAQIDTFIASKSAASGLASLDASSLVPIAQIPTGTTSSTVAIGNDSRITGAEQTANKAAASGYASLDGNSRVVQGSSTKGGVWTSVTTTQTLGTTQPLSLTDAVMTGLVAGGSTTGSGTTGVVSASFSSSGVETGSSSGQAGLGANSPLTDSAYAGQRIPVQFEKANGGDVLLADILAVPPSTDILSPLYGYIAYRSDLGANAHWRVWFYYRRQSDGVEVAVTPTISLASCTVFIPAIYYQADIPLASDFNVDLLAGQRAAEIAPRSIAGSQIIDGTTLPGHIVGQTVSTSGSPTAFTITGAAHTTLTASSEAIDVNVNLARTVQFATGSLTTQRAMLVQAPTYAFVGASTITTAVTLEISGPPVAGTNATITTPLSFRVASGDSNFGGNIRTDNVIGRITAGTFSIATAGVSTGVSIGSSTVTTTTVTSTAFTHTQNAATSGSPVALTLTGGAHTTLAASTEAIDVNLNFARTVQFATGALTTQRAMVIQAPTYAFVGASTITTAVTLDISGAPVAGTNATITTGLALRVAAGTSQFGGAITTDTSLSRITNGTLSIGTTSTTTGLSLGNSANTSTTLTSTATTITQNVATSGSPTLLTITGAAHTTLATTVEAIDVNINLARTVQFTGGSFATQRAVLIQAPTYSATSATTITSAATVYIDNSPIAGTSMTITNRYALLVAAGTTYLGGAVSANSTLQVQGTFTAVAAFNSQGIWNNTGAITPALTGTNNNYAPTGIGTALTVMFTSTASGSIITGINASQAAGRFLYLINGDATNSFVLNASDANSTSANRVVTANAANITVAPGGAVLLQYVSSFWRVLSAS